MFSIPRVFQNVFDFMSPTSCGGVCMPRLFLKKRPLSGLGGTSMFAEWVAGAAAEGVPQLFVQGRTKKLSNL